MRGVMPVVERTAHSPAAAPTACRRLRFPGTQPARNFTTERRPTAVQRDACGPAQYQRPAMAAAAALADLSTDDLMREISRRLECTLKPEKRIILIGAPFAWEFCM